MPRALILLAALLAGCGPLRGGGEAIGPVPLEDESLRRGKAVYDTRCQSCHQQGEGGMAPALNDKPLPEFLIRMQVRRGLGAMPAFPETAIPDDQLEDVARYVVALRRHNR